MHLGEKDLNKREEVQMNNEKDYSPVVFSSVTELLWLDGRKKEIAVTEHKKKKGIAKKASIVSSFKQPLTDILK